MRNRLGFRCLDCCGMLCCCYYCCSCVCRGCSECFECCLKEHRANEPLKEPMNGAGHFRNGAGDGAAMNEFYASQYRFLVTKPKTTQSTERKEISNPNYPSNPTD